MATTAARETRTAMATDLTVFLTLIAPLPTPAVLVPVAGYLLGACGSVRHDVAARRQHYDLPDDGVVKLAALGELRFTARSTTELELDVPRSLAGWIGQDGEQLAGPGRNVVMVRFRRPLPTRLTVLGSDLLVAVRGPDGKPVGVPPATVRAGASDQVRAPEAPTGDGDRRPALARQEPRKLAGQKSGGPRR